MSEEENKALAILDSAVSSIDTNRESHVLLQKAVAQLSAAIEELDKMRSDQNGTQNAKQAGDSQSQV